MTRERIHVVAAVLFSDRGEVLVTRRAAGAHQGGLWEFPGGKLHAGEGPVQGLARELEEELGVRVRSPRPLIRVRHDYPERSVLLDVWRVDSWEGRAHGREGQPLRWLAPEELRECDFPPADVPVIRAVRLPPLYLVTPAPQADRERFLGRLERCLARGVRLVQLRAPELSEAEYRALAREAAALCRGHAAWLLLNADPALVELCGAHGVHLNARRLLGLRARPLARGRWVGASCHDAAELARARRLDLDFATLSPVRGTHSHPGAAVLGWAGFRALAEGAGLPVYALGGMRSADLEAAREAGGQGIAAVRGLWEARA